MALLGSWPPAKRPEPPAEPPTAVPLTVRITIALAQLRAARATGDYSRVDVDSVNEVLEELIATLKATGRFRPLEDTDPALAAHLTVTPRIVLHGRVPRR